MEQTPIPYVILFLYMRVCMLANAFMDSPTLVSTKRSCRITPRGCEPSAQKVVEEDCEMGYRTSLSYIDLVSRGRRQAINTIAFRSQGSLHSLLLSSKAALRSLEPKASFEPGTFLLTVRSLPEPLALSMGELESFLRN